MKIGIEIHKSAAKSLQELDSGTRDRIVSELKSFANEPTTSKSDIKKLKGIKGKQDLYRLRIGNYRVIYAIQDDVMWVIEIMNREKGYKWLTTNVFNLLFLF